MKKMKMAVCVVEFLRKQVFYSVLCASFLFDSVSSVVLWCLTVFIIFSCVSARCHDLYGR